MFSYACGDIQWSGLGSETAIVGYNSQAKFFDNHLGNGFEDIGELVSCTRQIVSGRKKRDDGGVRGFGSTGCVFSDEELQQSKIDCVNRADFDDVNFPEEVTGNGITVENVVDQLPRCPATLAQVLVSPAFERYDQPPNCFQSICRYEPISLFLQRLYKFISVCCYDETG